MAKFEPNSKARHHYIQLKRNSVGELHYDCKLQFKKSCLLRQTFDRMYICYLTIPVLIVGNSKKYQKQQNFSNL